MAALLLAAAFRAAMNAAIASDFTLRAEASADAEAEADVEAEADEEEEVGSTLP